MTEDIKEPSKPENFEGTITKEMPSNAFKIEVPFLPKPKTLKDIAYERRMEIMKNYVKEFGLGNTYYFIKQIAEKYNISERAVYMDIDWIKGNFKPEDLQQVKIDLKLLKNKTLNLALLNIKAATSAQERNEAIKSAWVVIEKYREDLEEWGEKEKIADKLAVGVLYGDVVEIAREARIKIKKRRDAIPVGESGSQGDS